MAMNKMKDIEPNDSFSLFNFSYTKWTGLGSEVSLGGLLEHKSMSLQEIVRALKP